MLVCTKALYNQICTLKVALPNFVKNFVYQTFRPYFKAFNCHYLFLGRKDSTVLPITHCNLTLVSNKQVTYYVISSVMNVSGVVQKPVNWESHAPEFSESTLMKSFLPAAPAFGARCYIVEVTTTFLILCRSKPLVISCCWCRNHFDLGAVCCD